MMRMPTAQIQAVAWGGRWRRLLIAVMATFAGLVGLAVPAHAWCITNGSNMLINYEVQGADGHKRYAELPAGYAVCCNPRTNSACRRKTHRIRMRHDVEQGTFQFPKAIKWLKRVRYLARAGRVFYPSSGDTGARPPIPICNGLIQPGPDAHVYVYGTPRKSVCEVIDPKNVDRQLRTVVAYPGARVRTSLVVCNKTGTINEISVMFAAYAPDRAQGGNAGYWQSTGYFGVKVPSCRKLSLPHPYYNGDVYFRIVGGGKIWAGRDAFFCINKKKAFRQTRADKRCPAGMEKAGFFKRRFGPGTGALVIRK